MPARTRKKRPLRRSASRPLPRPPESDKLDVTAALGNQEHVCLFLLDRDCRFTYANEATTAFFGIAPRTPVGFTLEDLFPHAEAKAYRALYDRIFLTGEPIFTQTPTFSPATQRAYSCLKFPVFNHFGEVVAAGGVALDVNDQLSSRRKEDIQRSLNFHASKLAWLGEMAGGVAHEINNPLAIIHGHANRLHEDALRGEVDVNKVLRASMKIEAMVNRINRIVVSLREMATDSEGAPFQKTCLKTLVENTSQLFHVARDGRSAIQVDPIPEALSVECRSTQISQVLMHLILNAKEAVRGNDGKNDGRKWIRIQSIDAGRFVEIRVIDSGSGVPADLRDRIFDPFVTTGQAGRSSGLGLTIARRICELHGGSLQLDPNAPHTTFTLSLPKVQSKPAAPSMTRASSSLNSIFNDKKATEIQTIEL